MSDEYRIMSDEYRANELREIFTNSDHFYLNFILSLKVENNGLLKS